jgi:hypothetical protein
MSVVLKASAQQCADEQYFRLYMAWAWARLVFFGSCGMRQLHSKYQDQRTQLQAANADTQFTWYDLTYITAGPPEPT